MQRAQSMVWQCTSLAKSSHRSTQHKQQALIDCPDPSILASALPPVLLTRCLACNIRLAAAGVNAVRLPVGHWVLAKTRKDAAPFVEDGAR